MEFINEIPHQYLCPISLAIMDNPVIDNDGNSYDKSSILEHLKRKKESPLTRNYMDETHLAPNRALKDAIDLWKSQNTLVSSKNGESKDFDNTPVDLIITSINDLVKIETINPVGTNRLPLKIGLAVDISGSMASEAIIKNSNNENESHGLNLLDIVKHAVTAIIKILRDEDKLTIVSFSSSARVELPLTNMNPAGKARALVCLAGLSPRGSTNLWDGIQTSLEILKEDSANLSGIIVLTDGIPNINPPQGYENTLRKYIDRNSKFMGSCILNTFAFGYNADSELLDSISKIGNGSYSFIPDPGFVGTVFENSIANLMTTFATNVTLSIENSDGSINNIYYPYGVTDASWGKSVNLGNLKFGQSKSIVFKTNVSKVDQITATLSFRDLRNNKEIVLTKNQIINNNDNLVTVHGLRYFAAEKIYNALNYQICNQLDKCQIELAELLTILNNSPVKDNPYIKDLIIDISGQVSEAFSKREWFNKWGKHYIRSLVHAHLVEECNNFKDPGVQHFGGEMFKKIRDEADDIFISLPAPKPSIVSRSSNRSYVAPTNMRMYSNSAGPCFDGSCLVSMKDGTKRMINQLIKGDIVKTPNGEARIMCIVKTILENRKADFVIFNEGLMVTKWHPIRVENEWKFPCKIKESKTVSCPAIYSFVLDTQDEHVMIINDIECIALGHNIELPVAKHDYWGTNKVIKDLQTMAGWNEGLVVLKGDCIIRNDMDEAISLIQNF